MNKKENKRILYYKSYTDDFVKSKNQNYKIGSDYSWIKTSIIYRICSTILYRIAYIISFFYCKLCLHVKYENKNILKEYQKNGYFLYGNHTQPIGDVFIPAHIKYCKRIYVIASPANLGIPVIGKLLPMLGAIPISNSISNSKKIIETVSFRIKQNKCVVIYPEAHVWPYYTKIRPFDSTAFKFPIYCKVPSFAITTTYYKRKIGKKPGIKVYIDGPFFPDENLSKKENQKKLRNEIYECMKKRSINSTYEYIEYKEEK